MNFGVGAFVDGTDEEMYHSFRQGETVLCYQSKHLYLNDIVISCFL